MTKENRKKIFLILAFLFVEFTNLSLLLAQTEALDSLDRALHMTLESDQKISILNRLAYELRLQNPSKSKVFLEEALNLARKSNDKEEIAISLNTLGFLQNNSDNYSLALNSYQEAINIFIELNENNSKGKEIAQLYYQIGSLYKTLGDYQKAIENCISGLKIYETLQDKTGIALIYRVMGSIYKYKEDFEKSLFYYFSGLKINEEIGNQSGIANSYNNIGIVYLLMQDYEKALNYYKKSLEINLAENIESEAAINMGNIGVVYLEMNQLDSAYYYFSKRYSTALLHNDKKGITVSLESFGDFYLKKKEYTKAIEFYKRALPMSREIGILEISKNILRNMSDIYQEKSDFSNGLVYYKSYINLRDSLLNRESLQKIEQIEMEYNSEKERNNHLLSEQRIKLYIIAGFVTLILSVLFLSLIYMNQNLKLKRKNLEKQKLEIDKLQLQNDIYFRDKELVSKAIFIAENNELINDITRRLKSAISDPKMSNAEIKDIIKYLSSHSDHRLWDEFEFTFLQIHPDYYNSLRKQYPELTPNERRLSALLRLNLTTKEISNITHQSLHTLTVARTRLRKKLGIANSGENLATFLSQF
jgi:tetratricopeptide (TPR) repeat protein